MAEFIIYPHTVEFAHPRFGIGVREQARLWILHVAVDGHAEAAVGFVGAEDSEIEHAENAVIPFVGIVVLYNHFLGKGLVNWLNQKSSEGGGFLVNLGRKIGAVTHSA